jgi:hypothetical protein
VPTRGSVRTRPQPNPDIQVQGPRLARAPRARSRDRYRYGPSRLLRPGAREDMYTHSDMPRRNSAPADKRPRSRFAANAAFRKLPLPARLAARSARPNLGRKIDKSSSRAILTSTFPKRNSALIQSVTSRDPPLTSTKHESNSTLIPLVTSVPLSCTTSPLLFTLEFCRFDLRCELPIGC